MKIKLFLLKNLGIVNSLLFMLNPTSFAVTTSLSNLADTLKDKIALQIDSNNHCLAFAFKYDYNGIVGASPQLWSKACNPPGDIMHFYNIPVPKPGESYKLEVAIFDDPGDVYFKYSHYLRVTCTINNTTTPIFHISANLNLHWINNCFMGSGCTGYVINDLDFAGPTNICSAVRDSGGIFVRPVPSDPR